MNERHCYHFLFFPLGFRLLYTSTLVVLGVGYLFAMVHIFDSHAGRDGKPGLSVNDLIIAYSGSSTDTRLEASLRGPMAKMLPQQQRDRILDWIHGGAGEKEFNESIAPIMEQRCVSCHGGGNPHVPDLRGYDNVREVVHIDTGMDLFTLVRVSHIHLFGITFIFFIVSFIFVHAYMKPLWLKHLIIITPFLMILLDIGSWYLTKIYPPFAWMVMISGGLMGIAFAIQWTVSIYQMWFYKIPEELEKSCGIVS